MARRSYPVKDIKSTARPDLVWIYEPVTGRGPLHIADRECTHGPRGYRKSLTRCGRPIDPDHHAWEIRPGEFGSFRLCKGCGTRADFDKALADYQTWDKQRAAENDAKQQAEAIERKRLHRERRERLERLFIELQTRPLGPNDALLVDEISLTFNFGGHGFEVKEVD